MIKENLVFKEDLIEGKSVYPYITVFKKEPFNSFVLVEERDIGTFYIRFYDDVVDFFLNINNNLLNENNLNLENVFWFLLLRKYLKIVSKEKDKDIYDFIIKCEVSKGAKTGFRFSPHSDQREPDIWSTYFALASLKLMGFLEMYFTSKGQNLLLREIKDFLALHNKGNSFLHCLDKECEICRKTTSPRTIFFVIEILRLLRIDTRLSKENFLPYLTDKKKDPSLVFKLLSLKYLDLDMSVRDKTLQYLHQYQKANGGFSFKKIEGRINTTFWIVYVLDIYSWLLDYNPVGIYSFINSRLNGILQQETHRNLLRMMELSKLVILLSIIWRKFINQLERVIFQHLEYEKFVDLNYIVTSFGLTQGIEEVISYVNKYYSFNLRILDNKVEFNNHIRDLSPGMKAFAQETLEKVRKDGIAKLPSKKKDLKKFKSTYYKESFKFKEDILPLANSMIQKKIFKGIIKRKNNYYLGSFFEKIIVSDTDIKTDRLYSEKGKLKDIKNDIFNIILKLKNTSLQIKEEIESYLIIDEVLLAKERLKYIIRDASMEADFLNENIENSFNEDLYYVNFHTFFEPEIAQWSEVYSVLSNKLRETEIYLSEKIAQKEEIKNLYKTLENLENKIFIFKDSINRKFDEFKQKLRRVSEKYSHDEFSQILQEFDNLRNYISDFDKKFYEISQKITSKEEEIIKKRNEVINDWIEFKTEYNDLFLYYSNGFSFFMGKIREINELKANIRQESNIIREKADKKTEISQYKEAFNVIKTESEIILKDKSKVIKNLRDIIRDEINSKHRLYLLYKHLLDKLDIVEDVLVSEIALQVKSVKNKVIEERNRAKIEDFDDFVSHEIMTFKELISSSKESLDQASDKNIKDITNDFDILQTRFNEKDKEYSKKLNICIELIEKFEEKSNLTMIQWENFKEYFGHEIEILKEDYIINIITEKITSISIEKKTNTIKIADLKKVLGLNCRVIMDKIKDMIEISKLNAKLYDAEKCVLLYTDHYYKNKELKNFIDNELLKIVREKIGKILALYDSSIRKRTLSMNIEELQNRIKELDFEEIVRVRFNNKVKELNLDPTRMEYLETKSYFDSIIENNTIAINSIKSNLILFNDKLKFITQEFNYLKDVLNENYSKIVDDIEKNREKSHIKVKIDFENKWKKISNTFEQSKLKIENDLKLSLTNNKDAQKLSPELGEFSVKTKSAFLEDFKDKKEVINTKILILKDETNRGELNKFINVRKIRISQMLGMLQSRVEEDVEAREFKRAYFKIHKRERSIISQIKIINKNIKGFVLSLIHI